MAEYKVGDEIKVFDAASEDYLKNYLSYRGFEVKVTRTSRYEGILKIIGKRAAEPIKAEIKPRKPQKNDKEPMLPPAERNYDLKSPGKHSMRTNSGVRFTPL